MNLIYDSYFTDFLLDVVLFFIFELFVSSDNRGKEINIYMSDFGSNAGLSPNKNPATKPLLISRKKLNCAKTVALSRISI